MRNYLWSLLLVALATGVSFGRPPTPVQAIEEATEVLDELEKIPLKGIPPKLMDDAKAVIIIPRTIKAGFIIGGRAGHGLALMKTERGEWSDPTFVKLGGASIGFQAGVQSTDVLLVFKKKETLERLLLGKGKLTLGADAAIAAGPVGRQVAVATDGKLEAEIFSYSRSRGLFAGVSLDGAVLLHDKENSEIFKADFRPETALALAKLKAKLSAIAKEPPTVLIPAKP